MKISVLLSAYACDPTYGSEPGYGWNWASTLAKRGVEVHCLTQPSGKEAIENAVLQNNLSNICFHYVDVPRWVARLCSKTAIFGLYFHYFYWQRVAAKVAKQVAGQQRIDIVHHVTYGSYQQGSYMYKLRKPFLFGPVGGGQTAPPAFKAYFRNEWKFEVIRDLIGWFYQRFNPACYNTLKQAALVLVSNKETFDAIKNVRQKKETIYELDTALARDFSPETFPERETRSKMRILWVGRIFSRKGLELVFQSLQKVDARKCDYTLDIVGHGPWEHYIEEWKHQYGIADRVTWHGKLPYAEVKRFYKEADVFIFTSLRDAVGVQLLEAMAWGLPIVTLDMHGGGLLISPDYGIKVPPTTPEETTFKIAEAVQWLYDHPLERTEMGRRGFDFAKTLNWDAKTDKMIDTYKSTLEKQAKQ